MRIVSFNVCGIKQILGNTTAWVPERTFAAMFANLNADVVCFQETKIQSRDIDRHMAVVPGYNAFFSSSAQRKGYAGVAIYVRDDIGLLHAEEGLTGWLPSPAPKTQVPVPIRYGHTAREGQWGEYPDITEAEGLEIDGQGRALCVDLGVCVIIGLYCPANSQGNMEDFRNEFFRVLDHRVRSLVATGREVIVVGDINVAREPMDSATLQHALAKSKTPLDPELWKYGKLPHRLVNKWIDELGFVDTARHHHPTREAMFTCWNTLINARPANFGSRVDYIFASAGLVCTGANIMPELPGSDHCPIWAEFSLKTLPMRALPPLGRRLRQSFGVDIRKMFQLVNRSASRESNEPVCQDAIERGSNHDTAPDSLTPNINGQLYRGSKNSSSNDISKSIDQESIRPLKRAQPEHQIAETKYGGSKNPKQMKLTVFAKRSMESPSVHYQSRGFSDNHDSKVTPSSSDACLSEPSSKHSGTSSLSKISSEYQDSPQEMSSGTRPQVASQDLVSSHDKPKAAWRAIFQAKPPPRCRHNEPCILQKANKKGPNRGRSFWSCARPQGADNDPRFRCNFFQWA